MKRISIVLIIVILLLTSCKEAIENIEITTVKTGLTINNKVARPTKSETTTSVKSSEKPLETTKIAELTSTEVSETSTRESTLASSENSLTSKELTTISLSEIPVATTSEDNGSTGKQDFLEKIQNVSIADIVTTSNEPSTEKDRFSDEADDVQIDLSMFSKTVMYAELYNILFSPEEYEGMTIRMDGVYLYDEDVENNKKYHFVVVLDQAACCQQGMEFKLDEGLTYPKQGEHVEIKGEFRFYEEDGMPWYYLQVYDIR